MPHQNQRTLRSATLATLDRFHITRTPINHDVSLADFVAVMTGGY